MLVSADVDLDGARAVAAAGGGHGSGERTVSPRMRSHPPVYGLCISASGQGVG